MNRAMKKVLGLDIGTASIGWAVVQIDKNDKKNNEIVKCGVRVIPISTDENTNYNAGKAITTNAERAQKKAMRRNLQRRKLRRNGLLKNLTRIGIINSNIVIPEVGKHSTHQILKLRAQSAEEQVQLEDFGRVLLHLNKKRGYKSNRKANNSEEDGSVLDELELAKELASKNITPGQYVLSVFKKGKIKAKLVPPFYVSDLKNEFQRIYKAQQTFYPELLTSEFWDNIADKNKNYTIGAFRRINIEQAENKGSREEKLWQEYLWRSNALSHKLAMEEVAFVLVSLQAKISGSSNYLGDISDRSKTLFFEGKTVGQWRLEKISEGLENTRNQVFYRQDYIDEFNRIWDCQSQYYPKVLSPNNKQLIFHSIFYQRPLKSKKHLINICQFEQRELKQKNGTTKLIGPKVCPKSSPLFQEVKILQAINNLEITNLENNQKRKATAQERQLLFSELNYRESLNANEILKLLKLSKKTFEHNFKSLSGNTTNDLLYKAYLAIVDAEGYDISTHWEKASMQHNVESIHEIFTHLGIDTRILHFDASLNNEDFEKQASYQLWHLLYACEDGNEIKEEDRLKYGKNNVALKKALCNRYNFSVSQANVLCTIVFADDYGSLSTKALRKIHPHLHAGMEYSEACKAAGYNHSNSLTKEENENRTLHEELAPMRKNSLRNPVVEKILSHTINVVNELHKTYGGFDQINVELARELKASQKERDAMTKSINEATKRNDDIREKLRKEPFNLSNPTKRDINFYRMYEELASNGYKTLYSNQEIKAHDLFSGLYDVEHIIPQSVVYNDSFANKTIELRSENIEKANDTALDFVEKKYGEEGLAQYKARVNALYAKREISKAKRENLLQSASQLKGGFIERDIRDTQYISKKAIEILFDITPTVLATTGSITDILRREWGLLNTLKEINLPKYRKMGRTQISERKNNQQIEQIIDWTKRNDHRHHAMDALTVAFTTRAHIKYLNTVHSKSTYAIKKVDLFDAPLQNMRQEFTKALEGILVSIKAKNKVATPNTNTPKVRGKKGEKTIQLTPRKQLHNETIYGRRKKQEVIEITVNGEFTLEQAKNTCKPSYREALLARLAEYHNDPKKAFAGKNILSKKPILLDNGKELPAKVRVNMQSIIYTVRKPIDKALKIERVLDGAIRHILQKRLVEFNGDRKKAFSNLKENPIWLNKEKGIAIKSVTIEARTKNADALYSKKDQFGKTMLDAHGNTIPTSFVDTSGNHHMAIYEDAKGKWQELCVSYFEAISRRNMGLDIIDKHYKEDEGWVFKFSLKQNEMFIIPKEGEINLEELNLLDPQNHALISPYLFRVQSISQKHYLFTHHLETRATNSDTLKIKALQSNTFYLFRSNESLKPLVKVRINHIGQIVQVGEY